MAELKPCAHCGGKAKAYKCDASVPYHYYAYIEDVINVLCGRQLTHRFIMCEKCGIRTKVYATDKGAFNAWNRRVDSYDK